MAGLRACVERIHFGKHIKIFVILGISLCGGKERLFGVIEYLLFLCIGAEEILDVEPAIHSRGVGAERVIICGGVEEVVGKLGLTEFHRRAGGGDFGGAFRDGNKGVVEICETDYQGNHNSGGFEPDWRGCRGSLPVLWFGIHSDKAGDHGEKGGEDSRLENGEVDEVVNYDAEDAAKEGDGGEACVLQVVFFWRGLQGFYKQSEADGEGSGGGYVGSKQDV